MLGHFCSLSGESDTWQVKKISIQIKIARRKMKEIEWSKKYFTGADQELLGQFDFCLSLKSFLLS